MVKRWKRRSTLALAGLAATSILTTAGTAVAASPSTLVETVPSAPSNAVTRQPASSLSTVVPGPVAGTLQAGLDSIVKAGSFGAVAEVTDSFLGSWRGASGVADRTTGTPADPADHVRIGSVTKPFVATVLRQLVGEGKVSLTETVGKYLGSPVPNADTITVKMLLDHTSGTAEVQDSMPGYATSWQQGFTSSQLLGYVKNAPARSAPGAKYEYSNTNYLLLALRIEKVTGQRYDQVIKDRIITPLGLSGTSIPFSPGVTSPALHAYVTLGDQLTDVTAENPTRRHGFGQVVSTTKDVNTFFTALLSGKLLDGAELAAMKTTIRATSANPESLVGLGIFRRTLYCGVTVWGHTGQVGGYETVSYHAENLQRHVTFVSTTNTSAPADARWKFLETAFCGLPQAATGNSAAGAGSYSRGYHLSHVFTRTSSGTLLQLRRYDGTWYPANFGRAMTGQPAVVSGGGNDLRIFYRGTNKHLWQALIASNTTTYTDTGITIASSPAAYSSGPGAYQIFAEGPTSDDLLRIYPSGSAWKSQNLSGSVNSNLAAISTGPGYGHVYYRNGNGKLGQAYLSGGVWHNRELPFTIASSPSVTSPGSGHVEVYARGVAGTLYQVSYDDGTWSGKNLGTVIASNPAVYATSPTSVAVFARTAAGTLVSTTRTGSTWTTKNLGGSISGSPTAYSNGPADGNVYAPSKDGTKMMRAYRSGSTWVWQTVATL